MVHLPNTKMDHGGERFVSPGPNAPQISKNSYHCATLCLSTLSAKKGEIVVEASLQQTKYFLIQRKKLL